MEMLEIAILKQPDEINNRMGEMFRLLKEFTAIRALKKILIREEARHPITKNVNSISLIRMEEEENIENNRPIDEGIVEPGKSDEEEPPKEVEMKNEVERKADDKLANSTEENAVIKFDKGTVILRSGKSKKSFHRTPEPYSRIEKGIKNDIYPIAPTMTVNRLVLEWEEKIKLHQDKEMKYDQWRSKILKNERPASMKEECEVKDEDEVT
ncbi:hypothetical protein Tco_0527080 [Tanacetum coccineum]